eukprot:Platyproteum_vivax@DN13924_c0_g1_i1.p1
MIMSDNEEIPAFQTPDKKIPDEDSNFPVFGPDFLNTLLSSSQDVSLSRKLVQSDMNTPPPKKGIIVPNAPKSRKCKSRLNFDNAPPSLVCSLNFDDDRGHATPPRTGEAQSGHKKLTFDSSSEEEEPLVLTTKKSNGDIVTFTPGSFTTFGGFNSVIPCPPSFLEETPKKDSGEDDIDEIQQSKITISPTKKYRKRL